MNFERKEIPESRSFSPNLRLFNSQKYSQNGHTVSVLIKTN